MQKRASIEAILGALSFGRFPGTARPVPSSLFLIARQQLPQQKPTTRMKEADKGIQGFLSPAFNAVNSQLLAKWQLNWLASSARKGNRRPRTSLLKNPDIGPPTKR
jgi:hypothetical protein